jgi:hypothetical protein
MGRQGLLAQEQLLTKGLTQESLYYSHERASVTHIGGHKYTGKSP